MFIELWINKLFTVIFVSDYVKLDIFSWTWKREVYLQQRSEKSRNTSRSTKNKKFKDLWHIWSICAREADLCDRGRSVRERPNAGEVDLY